MKTTQSQFKQAIKEEILKLLAEEEKPIGDLTQKGAAQEKIANGAADAVMKAAQAGGADNPAELQLIVQRVLEILTAEADEAT